MRTHEVAGRVPIKLWCDGVPVEEAAMRQLENVAALPFVYRHVAVMPDVHWGLGATVGSVIPTRGAIVPAAVGVDVGCGMVAARTPLTASDLPDSLKALRSDVEWSIPVGFNDHRPDRAPVKEWERAAVGWKVRHLPSLSEGYSEIQAKHPKAVARRRSPVCQLGTLGGGNHFVEVCLDEEQRVWVMLHSGSRGVGNQIGTYFIERAKEYLESSMSGAQREEWRNFDPNLAWLVEGTPLFDDYVEAVGWAQRYARVNRKVMLRAALRALEKHTRSFLVAAGDGSPACETVINCHHNYVAEEEHFGERVFVTRKGAVRAGLGELGIIPGSMGTRSYIVRGLGNSASFESCSHGAGRQMSRGRAKREITLDRHAEATAGVECRKDAGVLDESPDAYKDVDAVMAAQSDLVEIVHALKAVMCVKG